MTYSILGFLACAAIIFFAGRRLSLYGDLLAERTGIGKAWVGLVLMAAVTSLPELVVGISAVSVVGSPDLAVGDILGSCAFNLGILSFMDVFTPKDRPLFSHLSHSHSLAAAFGVILISLVGLNLFLDEDIILMPFIGLTSLSFLVVYLIAVRSLSKFQKKFPSSIPNHEEASNDLSLGKVVLRYSLYAVILVSTALALPHFASKLAEETGLEQSFVGTLFLAIATSLPEIAVSFAAVRMGSTDMAVGNLLGSNLFNVVILFIDDLFYTQGHLLKAASNINLLSVFFVLMMTGVAMIGFVFPPSRKRIFMSWDTLTIFGLYVANIFLLYIISK